MGYFAKIAAGVVGFRPSNLVGILQADDQTASASIDVLACFCG